MRVSKDPEERKQELIETATKLFLEKGYEKTIIRDIVNQAEVTQGLFYYYFTSKEDILKAITTYYTELYQNQLRAEGFDECQDPVAGIQLILKVSIAYTSEHRTLITDIHKDGNQRFHDMIAYAFTDVVSTIFEKVILLGNQSGLFHCDYPKKTATAFIFGLFYTIHIKNGGVITEKLLEEQGFIRYYMARVFGTGEDVLAHIFDSVESMQ